MTTYKCFPRVSTKDWFHNDVNDNHEKWSTNDNPALKKTSPIRDQQVDYHCNNHIKTYLGTSKNRVPLLLPNWIITRALVCRTTFLALMVASGKIHCENRFYTQCPVKQWPLPGVLLKSRIIANMPLQIDYSKFEDLEILSIIAQRRL